MKKENETIENTLAILKTKECGWYEECNFAYDTRKSDAEGGNYVIRLKVLLNGVDMNYYVSFSYAARPLDRKFHYKVDSCIKGLRCNKVTDDFDRAIALYAKLVKEACTEITNKDIKMPENWATPAHESNDYSAMAEYSDPSELDDTYVLSA